VAEAVEPDLLHHGDAEAEPGLIDLAVNVRAGTPPRWLRERLAAGLGDLARYPDPRAATQAIAARHGRAPREVLVTAGAAEAFVLLARALRPRRAVVVHPQFTEPEAALRAAGHPVHRVLLPPPFTLDPAGADVPADADLVMVGNPTNPTSVLHPRQSLLALARPGRTLVVDEAFLDAVPGEPEALAGSPARPGGPPVPGVVVLRSLTKTWGLAGLRVGYLLAEPDVVAACRAVQPLWSVGSLGLLAAVACCEPPALAEAGRAAHDLVHQRAELVAALAGETPQVDVVPRARAPFLLLRLPGDAAAVRARLRAAGWAVRRGDTFPGLGPRWLRVAVRDADTSRAFVAALATALAADPATTLAADPAATLAADPAAAPAAALAADPTAALAADPAPAAAPVDA
jgi:histidinol-phosphate aminotransferase